MQAQFEVVILPVFDPDESLRFYRDQVGFDLDVDYAPAPNFRFNGSKEILTGSCGTLAARSPLSPSRFGGSTYVRQSWLRRSAVDLQCDELTACVEFLT